MSFGETSALLSAKHRSAKHRSAKLKISYHVRVLDFLFLISLPPYRWRPPTPKNFSTQISTRTNRNSTRVLFIRKPCALYNTYMCVLRGAFNLNSVRDVRSAPLCVCAPYLVAPRANCCPTPRRKCRWRQGREVLGTGGIAGCVPC